MPGSRDACRKCTCRCRRRTGSSERCVAVRRTPNAVHDGREHGRARPRCSVVVEDLAGRCGSPSDCPYMMAAPSLVLGEASIDTAPPCVFPSSERAALALPQPSAAASVPTRSAQTVAEQRPVEPLADGRRGERPQERPAPPACVPARAPQRRPRMLGARAHAASAAVRARGRGPRGRRPAEPRRPVRRHDRSGGGHRAAAGRREVGALIRAVVATRQQSDCPGTGWGGSTRAVFHARSLRPAAVRCFRGHDGTRLGGLQVKRRRETTGQRWKRHRPRPSASGPGDEPRRTPRPTGAATQGLNDALLA